MRKDTSFSVLQVIESWMGPGNKARVLARDYRGSSCFPSVTVLYFYICSSKLTVVVSCGLLTVRYMQVESPNSGGSSFPKVHCLDGHCSPLNGEHLNNLGNKELGDQ